MKTYRSLGLFIGFIIGTICVILKLYDGRSISDSRGASGIFVISIIFGGIIGEVFPKGEDSCIPIYAKFLLFFFVFAVYASFIYMACL